MRFRVIVYSSGYGTHATLLSEHRTFNAAQRFAKRIDRVAWVEIVDVATAERFTAGGIKTRAAEILA